MNKQNDEVCFHYTDINAFFSIIKNRKIWATDYRYLNDRLELEAAITRFIDKCPKNDGEALKKALFWYKDYYFHCVLSLSKSPEILSQWRAYADDGKGVAIGFSKNFLERSGLAVYTCEYKNQEEYLEQLFERHQRTVADTSTALKELKAINSFWEWVDTNKSIFDSLVNDLLLLKNIAFEEEQEVRAIISIDKSQIKYRTSSSLLVPYHEVEYWNDNDDGGDTFAGLAIKQVWLGPKCDKRNLHAITRFTPHLTSVHNYDCGYI